jgi:hypothetical protein
MSRDDYGESSGHPGALLAIAAMAISGHQEERQHPAAVWRAGDSVFERAGGGVV